MEKRVQEEPWGVGPALIETEITRKFGANQIPSYSTIKRYLGDINKKFGKFNFNELKLASQTKDGLQFLRGNISFTMKVKNKMKSVEGLIWISHWQSALLMELEHIYVDGTFSRIPFPFKQCISIIGREIYTGKPIPLLWSLINSKKLEAYDSLLNEIKNILRVDHPNKTIKWDSVTLDFEKALHLAFTEQYPDVYIIGCLFHFKFRLFEKAMELGLTTTKVQY